MVNKRSIQGVDVSGKTVLVRVDFNVPTRNGIISDDSRIRAALPTLNLLKKGGAKVVICSHFGRPKGEVVEDMRLGIVGERLSELLGTKVANAGGPNGDRPAIVINNLGPGDFAMLENMRFESGEEANDDEFSKHLASLADIYVNDAFGAAHRAHASTTGVTAYIPAYAGLLMVRELEMLGRSSEGSTGATIAIIGGAKVADKIQVLRNLSAKVDTILVGGGMVAAFYVAKGRSGGAADVSEEDQSAAMELLESGGANVVLPADVVTTPEFDENAPASICESTEVPLDGFILDIGPRSATEYARIIGIADTIIWNGPMGVFEWTEFAKGSVAVANAVADNKKSTSVIGGGSTAEIVGSLGLVNKITHVSTGGGASLEFLEGKILPGVAAIPDARYFY
jgi:phosphoglycerate kinase